MLGAWCIITVLDWSLIVVMLVKGAAYSCWGRCLSRPSTEREAIYLFAASVCLFFMEISEPRTLLGIFVD